MAKATDPRDTSLTDEILKEAKKAQEGNMPPDGFKEAEEKKQLPEQKSPEQKPAQSVLEDADFAEFQAFKQRKAAAEEKALADLKAYEEAEKDAPAIHERLVKQYGKGYVVARRGPVESVFTETTWKRLGGIDNKEGWKKVVKTPPEVSKF